jgi:hypothetical protein
MIIDYASLQTAIASWLARADLTTQIPTFIQLAEARMNKDLRVLEMQTELLTALSTDKSITLPDDVLELQSVRINTLGKYFEVNPMPPENMQDRDVESAVPYGYVRVGSLLYMIGGQTPSGLVPGPGEPSNEVLFSLLYFGKLPALGTITITPDPGGGGDTTTEVTSNWLLQKEPGLYLYAALIEASPYLQDDARTLVWAEQYKSILSAMRMADDNARYGNAPAMRRRSRMP